MYRQQIYKQKGISLVGLIVVLAILAMIGILAAKIVPTVLEYNAISNAIVKAKASGNSVSEIRMSFNKSAEVNYITSISSSDLEIVKEGEGFEVSFAYDKKIPLVGPASILIEYTGTTRKKTGGKKADF